MSIWPIRAGIARHDCKTRLAVFAQFGCRRMAWRVPFLRFKSDWERKQ